MPIPVRPKPKQRVIWKPLFQDEQREHKDVKAWLNDMLVESKDG